MKPSAKLQILIIGSDTTLDYLIGRYAQRSGVHVIRRWAVPQVGQVNALKPVAILFPSVESLEAAGKLIAGLENSEIPIMVCSSVAEEARARELGADYCLFHPLSYKDFSNALENKHIQALTTSTVSILQA